MRCPECGARNTDGAAWCTQCFHRFDAVAEPAPQASEPMTSDAAAPADPVPGGPERGAASDRDVRERDGVVEWRCPRCHAWTALEVAACAVCGTARSGFGVEAGTRPTTTDAPVFGASLALPGLGHLLARRTGSGIARLGLTLLWLGGGLAILLGGASVVARLPGLVLLLGVVVLWVGTVLDARELEAGGSRELLDGRALLWLVVGVTVALILALLLAAAAGMSAA